MKYSSSLIDNMTPAVLDTSVLINLHASQQGSRILDSLPNEIIVPEHVVTELQHETSKTQGQHCFIQHMIATSKVRVAALNEREYQVFGRLVSGNPSLGDGEAATIAIAATRMLLPIIDERKGRLQAQTHCSGTCPGWSLDILRHPVVVAALGMSCASDALYFALRDGRMRIHESHCDHVVDVIGVQHALECKSLPRYRYRRDLWKMRTDRQLPE